MPVLIDVVTKGNLLQTRAPFKRVLKAIETNDETKWQWFNALPSRKLANALAGVPAYPWKSSYDICRRHPSERDLHTRLYDYLIRELSISKKLQS